MCEDNMTNTSGRKFEEKYERAESRDASYDSDWVWGTENGGKDMMIWSETGDRRVGNGHVIWDTSPAHLSNRVQKFDDLKKPIRKSSFDEKNTITVRTRRYRLQPQLKYCFVPIAEIKFQNNRTAKQTKVSQIMAGRDSSGCIDPYEELERQEAERRNEERATAPDAETTREEERHAGRVQREREVAANAPLSRTGTGKRRAPYPVNYDPYADPHNPAFIGTNRDGGSSSSGYQSNPTYPRHALYSVGSRSAGTPHTNRSLDDDRTIVSNTHVLPPRDVSRDNPFRSGGYQSSTRTLPGQVYDHRRNRIGYQPAVRTAAPQTVDAYIEGTAEENLIDRQRFLLLRPSAEVEGTGQERPTYRSREVAWQERWNHLGAQARDLVAVRPRDEMYVRNPGEVTYQRRVAEWLRNLDVLDPADLPQLTGTDIMIPQIDQWYGFNNRTRWDEDLHMEARIRRSNLRKGGTDGGRIFVDNIKRHFPML